MFLGKRIRELREEKELLQRQLAAELEIDTPMYSKIERGERKAKREQVIKMAKLFEADEKELLTLWLAGQINELVKGEEEIAKEAIKVVGQNL
ncbi:helix-turn-helix domain-containing protein [Marinifilum sp. D737]|uniref:helix-turn-helix domain-containing protein n=1 Tax=Marinifilum sp. D737 TaxID=2969628 RepID=UPI002274ACBA|nr:helix-turn-helix transcriptional regulator [Marinifilum sp. D737]MCY1636591.1 helix-turn-helix domain-containing protein [Marinifilum sp. D737]